MADTTIVRYLYPPDWDGALPGDGLTDAFPKIGWKTVKLQFTNISDGTGETLVKKLDLSTLRGPSGQPVARTMIEHINFANYGMQVALYWERTPANELAIVLPQDAGDVKLNLLDPGTGDGTDGTGDILLSTLGASNEDSYNIVICLKLKENIRDNAID